MLIKSPGVVDLERVGDQSYPKRSHGLVVFPWGACRRELPDLVGDEPLGRFVPGIPNRAPCELDVLTVVEAMLPEGPFWVHHHLGITLVGPREVVHDC
jgi:hypothetical protein